MTAPSPVAAPPSHPDHEGQDSLHRSMSARHLMMISFGGVIGTGLFLSSGWTIHTAGPIGTILAYVVGAVLVYLVMLCLGELAVAMPVTGAFHVYARRFLGPATGFTVAVLYWLTWTVALGSEFTGVGLIMQHWFPTVPVWVWSAVAIVLIFALNAASVRVFAEAESFLSGIKVAAIIVFIGLGSMAILGILPVHGNTTHPGLHNLVDGGIFPNGVGAVFTTMLAVNFAFSGTELIGITAGETRDPATTIPRAIHATLWRLAVFFIGSMVVMACLIPWRSAGVEQSPFVVVFDDLGLAWLGNLMNVVVLTAILSAANSGLYASTRMLWSLSNEGTLPAAVARTSRRGIPVVALALSMVGGLLALLSSVIAPGTVYLVLVSVSGLAVVLVWMAIAASQISFRRRWLAEGRSVDELGFRTPGHPVVGWAALVLSGLSCVLVVFDPTQRVALYCTLGFVAVCYAGHFLATRARSLGSV